MTCLDHYSEHVSNALTPDPPSVPPHQTQASTHSPSLPPGFTWEYQVTDYSAPETLDTAPKNSCPPRPPAFLGSPSHPLAGPSPHIFPMLTLLRNR